MPDRCYDGGYDYGFNGMEKQDGIYDNGNAYDFGARILDPRLGRWFSRDPMATSYPSMSPYVTFNDNPIIYVDPDGRDLFPGIVAYMDEVGTEIGLGSGYACMTFDGSIDEEGGKTYYSFSETTIKTTDSESIYGFYSGGSISFKYYWSSTGGYDWVHKNTTSKASALDVATNKSKAKLSKLAKLQFIVGMEGSNDMIGFTLGLAVGGTVKNYNLTNNISVSISDSEDGLINKRSKSKDIDRNKYHVFSINRDPNNGWYWGQLYIEDTSPDGMLMNTTIRVYSLDQSTWLSKDYFDTTMPKRSKKYGPGHSPAPDPPLPMPPPPTG